MFGNSFFSFRLPLKTTKLHRNKNRSRGSSQDGMILEMRDLSGRNSGGLILMRKVKMLQYAMTDHWGLCNKFIWTAQYSPQRISALTWQKHSGINIKTNALWSEQRWPPPHRLTPCLRKNQSIQITLMKITPWNQKHTLFYFLYFFFAKSFSFL